MKRCVVYCMTRNLYRMVIPSLKSLLAQNQIDKVYLLIEDDDTGFWLPDCVECINVSEQEWFPKNGANYNCRWTYMALMRIALCYVLPDVDKILSLDLDTIINGDLSELWELPMDDKYIAGSIEKYLTEQKGFNYINFGVCLMNLAKFRDGMADRIISLLNKKQYLYPEQDCANEEIPEDGKLIIGEEYNFSIFSGNAMRIPKIIHFAAFGAERFKEQKIVCDWGEKDWGEILNA